MSSIKIVDGGVTAAKGFEAAAAAAGIKYQGRTDMALVYSEAPCVTAGTFTSNVVKAAPVIWDRDLVRNSSEKAQAIVANSGIANACTGKEGLSICEKTAQAAAEALHIPERSVLLGSTGVIGMQIPLDRITAGVQKLAAGKAATKEAGEAASRAIMTTDTINKQAACSFEAQGADGRPVTVTVGGMSKGSGMIHPNMCTMLAYITTDAAVDKATLQHLVSEIVTDSFNMISVDGDTSTNDTLLVLANGLAGNKEIREPGLEDQDVNDQGAAVKSLDPSKDVQDAPEQVVSDHDKLREALTYVCTTLAKTMAGDGEGATKLIESKVIGADTKEHARIFAKSVICSNLTKAAIFGKDANWGRVLCALGYSGVSFDPENVDLYFAAGDQKMLIFSHGKAADYSEEEATKLLGSKMVDIISDMHMGTAEATAWGCDLTYDYVKINADYRS